METRQELFEAAVSGIVLQGKKSVSEGRCVYVGKDDIGCAFGVLFPQEVKNELRNTRYNSISFGSLYRDAKTTSPLIATKKYFDNNPVFLSEYFSGSAFTERLQTLHDRPENWLSKTAMLEAISELATSFVLDTGFISSLDWTNFESNLDRSVVPT